MTEVENIIKIFDIEILKLKELSTDLVLDMKLFKVKRTVDRHAI